MPARKIAVLTSGGDAPGMNAAIRAVVRGGIDRGWEVVGVRNGYAGLIAGDLVPLDARAVGGIIQLGGTMLGSARCPEFREPEPRRRALEHLAGHGVSGLVVVGGDGSQRGAHALSQMGSRSPAWLRPSTTTSTAPRSPSASTRPSTSRWRRSTG